VDEPGAAASLAGMPSNESVTLGKPVKVVGPSAYAAAMLYTMPPGKRTAGSQSRGGQGVDPLPPVLAAHSPNSSGAWHTLTDHLAGTGRQAGEFGEEFGSADACRFVGEVHDLGKADPVWQRYLAAAAAGNKLATVDHKHAGAFVCGEWGLGTCAYVVAGHHGGIPNAADLRAKLAGGPTPGQRVAMSQVEQLGVVRPEAGTAIPPQFLPVSHTDGAGKRRMEFWLRMVFSALVDADRLDTEGHFRDGVRAVAQPDGLADLDARCGARRRIAVAERQNDPVAAHRVGMFNEVMASAAAPSGWFELTAPTGSGKTIAALSFALRHAAVNGHRRVVTAVPFISVTEQVAGVYRALLEDESEQPVVLEQHSGMTARNESQTDRELWSRLTVENWDARVIVTTTVQLLESLFDNRPSRTRKLHRLARSVLVLDEVQSLPWRLLEPTLEVLRELVRSYGCSVVLSTATQPPFGKVGNTDGIERRQLVDARWFGVFDRTSADVVRDPVSWDDFAARVAAESDQHQGQCLVVLNTIADAREVCNRLAGRPELIHLSSRLCPAHRMDTLNTVLSRLRRGEPCTLVSTQVIEAGIDVDFPVAIRAYGPLPAIAQVAGRVNRHGLREGGKLVVLDPIDGHVPPDEYKLGTQICRELMRAGANPLAKQSLETYYDGLIRATSDKLDKLQIQRERELLNFATVAERYRVIADETQPILVSYGDFDPLHIDIPDDPAGRRSLLRDVQRYTVSLRDRELNRCKELVEERAGGVMVWHGPYDHVFGLSIDRETEALIW
jgi:CRISPR-associated endonuclease/helicase Cas3